MGWGYVLLAGDWMMIHSVEVRGLKALDQAEVQKGVFAALDARKEWRPWSTRHAWFLNYEALEKDLQTRLFAENVTVDKTYGYVLRLMVEERESRFVLHSHQQYLWVDASGLVTEELTKDERRQVQARLLGQVEPTLSDPPVIQRDLDELIASGYIVADTESVRHWMDIALQLKKMGIAYRELNVAEQPKEIDSMETVDTYRILLDSSKDLAPQVENYKAFKSSRTKFKVSEYLDIRIPGRVYYK